MVDLLSLQKKFILDHLHDGDTAVDFTMGNGYDTVFLSQTVGPRGSVTAFDIQPDALLSTERNLRTNGCPDNWRLICASHDRAREFVRGPIKAGMFNLGYLPGSGRKQLTTMRKTTLPAVERALDLLGADSVLLVAVYPGHPEARRKGRSWRSTSPRSPGSATASRGSACSTPPKARFSSSVKRSRGAT